MIAVVDDDAFVRDALEDLITSFGHRVRTFHSADGFLQSGEIAHTSCLITDLQMPGLSGLDLQQHLLANGHGTPVIFLTAFPEHLARWLRPGLCVLAESQLQQRVDCQNAQNSPGPRHTQMQRR